MTIKQKGVQYDIKKGDYAGYSFLVEDQPIFDNYGTQGAVRYYANAVVLSAPTTGHFEIGEEVQLSWDTTWLFDQSCRLCFLYDSLGMSWDVHANERSQEEIDELEAQGVTEQYCEDESNACDWDCVADVECIY